MLCIGVKRKFYLILRSSAAGEFIRNFRRFMALDTEPEIWFDAGEQTIRGSHRQIPLDLEER
jgi:hypothetical protein